MTSAVILDLRKEELEREFFEPSRELAERIASKKSEARKKESIQAYTLLAFSYKKLFGNELPEVAFADSGKPCLKESNIKISISHTDGLCAVAFSKNNVGIDAEKSESFKEKQHLIDRFVNKDLQNNLNSGNNSTEQVSFYTVKENELVALDVSEERNTTAERSREAARLWTSLEALLKTRDGFADIKRINEIAKSALVKTVYHDGFVITVAHEK